MRTYIVTLGLTLAFAASALVHAEPDFVGGKPGFTSKLLGRGGSGGHFSGGKQCVEAKSVRAESADGNTRLILHVGSGARVSHLPQPCDGLMGVNDVAKLHLQAKDGKYCAGDSFTVGEGLMSVVGLEGDHSASHCTLGPFESVSEMTLSENFRR